MKPTSVISFMINTIAMFILLQYTTLTAIPAILLVGVVAISNFIEGQDRG